MNNNLKWHKVQTGVYETTDRKYRAFIVYNEYNNDEAEWRLMTLIDPAYNDYEWCQTFNLLRECKEAADMIERGE
jgi:hypothetical protein